MNESNCRLMVVNENSLSSCDVHWGLWVPLFVSTVKPVGLCK